MILRGSKIVLHYTLSLATGEVADTTRPGAPAELIVGQSDLLPAFETCLVGLRVGDKRRFEVPCLEAYGPSEIGNVHTVAREDFPPDMTLAPGLVIGFETPSGEEVPGTIVELNDREVRVDFSHPLSGHDLIFDVEILSVSGEQD